MGEGEASNSVLVYQARAGDDVKKRETVLDCVWGNLEEPVHVSSCLQVLSEVSSGSFVYHTEVVFVP